MKRTIFESEHEDFRKSVKEFVNRSVLPRYEEFIEAKEIPRDVWLEAGRQGFLGLLVDEKYGGGGMADDWRFSAIVGEEFGKVSIALSSCVGIHADVNAPYLTNLTTEEQRERWLPKYVTGELLTAIGMTEPSGGSDLANLKTTATQDGDHWILNGSKTFITNGYNADMVIVAARSEGVPGPKGITLFGVETGTPGFERGRKLDKVGQTESDTAELFFKDCRVPAANIIGQRGMGFIHMMQHLPQERLGSAVSNLAHARQLLEETIAYVKERQAFGQPVGSFQYNKFIIAEMVTKVEATQAFVDQAIGEHMTGELSAVDAAKIKWWVSDLQNSVLDTCLQLHGGFGFMNEYRIGRAWRDARVTKIWAGSNEIMKELIGRDLGL